MSLFPRVDSQRSYLVTARAQDVPKGLTVTQNHDLPPTTDRRRTRAELEAEARLLRRKIAQITPVLSSPGCVALVTGDATVSPQLRRLTAIAAADELRCLVAESVRLTAVLYELVATYPAAHDDDWDTETFTGAPGYCRCGRWAETCLARQAAAAGHTHWEAEDGTFYPVDELAAVNWRPVVDEGRS